MTEMSKEEQIGFHKGSIQTLGKEREELAKMVNVVEQLIHVHLNALKELGVDYAAEIKKAQEAMKKAQEPKQPGESISDKLA